MMGAGSWKLRRSSAAFPRLPGSLKNGSRLMPTRPKGVVEGRMVKKWPMGWLGRVFEELVQTGTRRCGA